MSAWSQFLHLCIRGSQRVDPWGGRALSDCTHRRAVTLGRLKGRQAALATQLLVHVVAGAWRDGEGEKGCVA